MAVAVSPRRVVCNGSCSSNCMVQDCAAAAGLLVAVGAAAAGVLVAVGAVM
jgi:hypothetical protein